MWSTAAEGHKALLKNKSVLWAWHTFQVVLQEARYYHLQNCFGYVEESSLLGEFIWVNWELCANCDGFSVVYNAPKQTSCEIMWIIMNDQSSSKLRRYSKGYIKLKKTAMKWTNPHLRPRKFMSFEDERTSWKAKRIKRWFVSHGPKLNGRRVNAIADV